MATEDIPCVGIQVGVAHGEPRFGPSRARTGQAIMMPTLLSRLKLLSPVASAFPACDSTIRLSLSPALDRRATVDGAWWPRSSDAAAIDQRLGRSTMRVSVYRDAWVHIPRRIPARGRQVRVGWFGHADPRVVISTLAGSEQIVLLITEPDTARGPAEATLELATQDTTGFSPTEILTIAHLPAVPYTRERP
ncbi:DUF5994 family protein [Nonomuraea sp. CA-141351]|uniref:DUF5994 family protein n=1 Tax=Nonomuraea sp. CA-141351 TaxID=3239996 RepID=UPI003D8EDFA4